MIELIDANNIFRREWEAINPTKTRARLTYEMANAATHPMIYVWDGFNHNARRREIFPGYKIRDHSGQEDLFAGLDLMREILSHSKAIQVECEYWEADDVIATLARHLAVAGELVTVQTNDLDYYQIMATPGITLDGVSNPDKVPARYIPLYKTLKGDSSDKIPGLKGFGIKAFNDLSEHWDDMCDMLATQNWDALRELPFTKACKLWLMDDDNCALLYAYWQIVHMIPVPLDVIDKGWRKGVYNPAAAEALFQRFML